MDLTFFRKLTKTIQASDCKRLNIILIKIVLAYIDTQIYQ